MGGRLQGYVRHAQRGSGQPNGAPKRTMSAAPPPVSYGVQRAPAPVVSSSKVPLQQLEGNRDVDIAAFLARCDLDESAWSLLEEQSEAELEKVMTEFDPSGTKDGNVFGRLEGFVRSLSAREARGGLPPAKRPRAL